MSYHLCRYGWLFFIFLSPPAICLRICTFTNAYISDRIKSLFRRHKALTQCTSAGQESEHHQTFNHWHFCLLCKITKGEHVDLCSNNKHIGDAWQVMASSGNKKPPEFTVSNVDSCRPKSLLLTDVPACFSIKVLSKERWRCSSWRLILPRQQISLTPKGTTAPAIMYALVAVLVFLALLTLLTPSHITWGPCVINKLYTNHSTTWSAWNVGWWNFLKSPVSRWLLSKVKFGFVEYSPIY